MDSSSVRSAVTTASARPQSRDGITSRRAASSGGLGAPTAAPARMTEREPDDQAGGEESRYE